jgi:hypothetical protein
VDADRARHLRESTDRFLDLVARDHHQVRELVDHDDDEGKRLGRPGSLLPVSSSTILMFRLYCSMLRTPSAGERLVALLHLADGPPQRVGGLLRDRRRRREQVRDLLVHPELEPLGVDHDHPHVVRRRAVEDARQHRRSGRRTCRCLSTRR